MTKARMKAAGFAVLDNRGSDLGPIAVEALTMLAKGQPPGAQTRATEFNAVDEVGHSDAG